MIKKKTVYVRETSPVGVEANNKDWLLQMIPKWRKNGMKTHPKAHYMPSLQWKLTPQFVVKMDTTNWGEQRPWHFQKDHVWTRVPPNHKEESEFGALKLGETPPQPWTHIKPQELTGLQTPSPGSPLPLRWLLFFPRDAHARAIFFLSTSIKPALLSPWCVLETFAGQVKDVEVDWYTEVHRQSLGRASPGAEEVW